MRNKLLVFLLITAALVILSDADLMAQCAMCKKNVESDLETGGSIGKGINKGILYLLTVPYFLLASIGFIFFRKQISEKWTSFRKRTTRVS